MRTIRIPEDVARLAMRACESKFGSQYHAAAAKLEKALAPKRSVVAHRKEKAKKTRAKRSETRSIRALVVERAGTTCECGCGMGFTMTTPGELDHQFGRVRAKQSVENTWLLRHDCHAARTRNSPSAAWWLQKLLKHAEKYGYHEEFRMAARRLRSLEIQAEAAQ
jgi:hypothetical protein